MKEKQSKINFASTSRTDIKAINFKEFSANNIKVNSALSFKSCNGMSSWGINVTPQLFNERRL
ncbi:MAG: hypothetical protein PXY39_14825 [archaeon]|nr:hypothetical protein [archaeon]